MREPRILLAIVTASLGLAATACGGAVVRPDDMSAADHRREAAREMAYARDQTAQYDPQSDVLLGTGERDDLYPVIVYNPDEGRLRAAEAHMGHAREHLAAAEVLERFEAEECAQVPAEARGACPLIGGVSSVDDIPGGVLMRLEPGVEAAPLAARMRCHLAYARARAYEQNQACPIYLRGVIITTPASGGTIGLTSGEAEMIELIRKLIRAQILPPKGPIT
jgi:hypothetical protein